MKPLITEPSSGKQPLQGIFFAGSLTGGLVAPVTSPFITLKLQQQVHGGSLAQRLRTIVGRHGVYGLFRGLPLHCGLESIGSGVYLTTYFAAKRACTMVGGEGVLDSLPVKILAAPQPDALVGSRYTLDVVRTRVMSSLTPAPTYGAGLVSTSIRDCYRESGVHAFHRGIGPTLLRAAPVAGVVLPVYDAVLAWLSARV
eukprot:CAMPEP_0181254812 /NCGR_PEP_ID=MMETSP1096-20121128/48807_1 /TAXON_ID=156174 ORGANISM="Chrysochromulina ericina, Strain CCMP281" /NCGR_SAMPLE_ID=MMETSP1096 /ASSEMBLY_ACC=CAM_ASM_000453 /LENGTH=198 /DNA_ID=CAMNT_0023352881 /DNA_START=77 /DNA_END=674 /DNA_ORIENTATION=+